MSWAIDNLQDREKAIHDSCRNPRNGRTMPRRAKGPRLYLEPRSRQWVIRDGTNFMRTGCCEADSADAEKFLAQYLAFKHKPKASGSPMIADVLNVYGKEVAPHKKSARNMSYNIGSLIRWWGAKTVADITAKSCRTYVAEGSKTGRGADLGVLKSAVAYWDQEYGPLTVQPVFWRPKGNPPKERWLTYQEAARLLNAARRYQHLRRLILLGLYTGSRPGVLLALTWAQVDLDRGILFRVPRGMSQGDKKRSPPVKLGKRILTHLKRWKAVDASTGIEFICHFDGRRVEDPHGTWNRVTKAAGLVGVTPHTLRHTRATWMAQKGVSPFAAAGFLGMTIKTWEHVYAHHHPDFQDEAANI